MSNHTWEIGKDSRPQHNTNTSIHNYVEEGATQLLVEGFGERLLPCLLARLQLYGSRVALFLIKLAGRLQQLVDESQHGALPLDVVARVLEPHHLLYDCSKLGWRWGEEQAIIIDKLGLVIPLLIMLPNTAII